MNIINLKKLGLAVALLGTVAVASAADGKDSTKLPAPEGSGTVVAASQAAQQQQAQAKAGLTREQVREDLKQYQRDHANPSYSELVFLR